MSSKPSILLDEPILGMDVFLRDLGWNVVKVKDAVGAGASDGAVIDFARQGVYVVVTPDRKLAKRCRVLGIRVVELGLEDLARKVHESLLKEIGS